MKFKNAEVDMLHGPLIKKLLLFTLPIALSSILQQLFNAADTAVVGYFGNKDALAAVGTNTEIVALIVTVSSGLSIGANILVANLIGKNRKNEIPSAVKTSVVLSVLIGAFGMDFGAVPRRTASAADPGAGQYSSGRCAVSADLYARLSVSFALRFRLRHSSCTGGTADTPSLPWSFPASPMSGSICFS